MAAIGCGDWGKNLVRNSAQFDALAAICDHNRAAADELAAARLAVAKWRTWRLSQPTQTGGAPPAVLFPGTDFVDNLPPRFGRNQVVRHRVLLPPYGGSRPPAPGKYRQCPRRRSR